MDKNSRRMWEQRPDESNKAFNAFLEYLKMPINDPTEPENERTLANLSQKLGYSVAVGKAASSVEQWSSKYNWQERVRAYEAHVGQLEITVRDASLEQFQQEVISKRSQQSALANTLLNNQLLEYLQNQKAGVPVKSTDIARIINSMKLLDDVERRLAGLPTSYQSERVEDENTNETRIFTIGG